MNYKLRQFMLLALALAVAACSQHQQATQATEPSAAMDSMSSEAPAASTVMEMADGEHAHPDPSGDHSENSESHGHHSHAALEVPAGEPVPAVTLMIHDDTVQGWNLEIQTTNFQFAPEKINQPSQFNEGHAHLYVDGEKVARLYGPWYHLATLPPGEHTLMVTLNANGHEEIQVNGETIMDTVTLTVPES